MKREQINKAIKERENLFMKEADTKPLTDQEQQRVKELLKKYKPTWM